MTNLLVYINRTEHRAWMYEEALAPAFPGIAAADDDNLGLVVPNLIQN